MDIKKRASGYPEALKQKLLTIEVYVWVYLVRGNKTLKFLSTSAKSEKSSCKQC